MDEDKEYIAWWYEWSGKILENWLSQLRETKDGEETVRFLKNK